MASQFMVIQHGQPILVNVPQTKVVVQQPPSGPWLTYWVPNLSLLFALIAAAFAVASVLRMNRQIGLMHDQIEQQEKAIEWATKDYDATMLALGITRNQAELADRERARFPMLELSLNGTRDHIHFRRGPVGARTIPHGTTFGLLTFELTNINHDLATTASDITVEIVLPDAFYPQSSMPIEKAIVFSDDDGPRVGNVRLPNALTPATSVFVGEVWVAAVPGTYSIYWMAKTREGFFPRDNVNYGGQREVTITIDNS